jgi:iron complex transport system substrate-binding protein
MKKTMLFLLVSTILLTTTACGKKAAEVDKDVSGAKTEMDSSAVNTETDADSSATKTATDAESSATKGAETKDAESGATAKGETAEEADNGEEVSDIALSDQRVVASSVAVVEILDALGVPMVGVPTSTYELPASVADAKQIGNPMEPDMEIIASLNPTVIISVSSLSENLKAQFETLGIPGKFMDLTSYDGLKKSILSLGTYFGVKEKAEGIIAGFESKEAAITEKTSGKESPSVLIIFGAGDTFMVATENTYVGDLAKRVGAENVASGLKGSFIPVDMEFLADKNPEYILFLTHANPEESLAAFRKEFENNEAWQNFDAVKNDRVIALDTGYFGMSANLLATAAMEKLTEYLYTE